MAGAGPEQAEQRAPRLSARDAEALSHQYIPLLGQELLGGGVQILDEAGWRALIGD